MASRAADTTSSTPTSHPATTHTAALSCAAAVTAARRGGPCCGRRPVASLARPATDIPVIEPDVALTTDPGRPTFTRPLVPGRAVPGSRPVDRTPVWAGQPANPSLLLLDRSSHGTAVPETVSSSRPARPTDGIHRMRVTR
jgi:hypothetical protein